MTANRNPLDFHPLLDHKPIRKAVEDSYRYRAMWSAISGTLTTDQINAADRAGRDALAKVSRAITGLELERATEQ